MLIIDLWGEIWEIYAGKVIHIQSQVAQLLKAAFFK